MTTDKIQTCFDRRWLAASFVSAVGVLTLTHVPQAVLPRLLHEKMADKVEHVVAYGVVSLLFVLSLKRSAPLTVLIAGLLALAGIGALDEITQPLVNRTASVMDYAADLAGIAAACVIFLVKRRPVFDTAAS